MKACNVLLVDDEEEFASTLAERLALRGIQVRVATSGEEALARIAEDAPQVVVLDVMMPGMSGHAVLTAIKSNYPRVQVILVTGIGATKDGIDGMKLGAFAFLMKPVEIETLLKTIGDALNKTESEVD
jgi:DNA-binding NtrC family response regulator